MIQKIRKSTGQVELVNWNITGSAILVYAVRCRVVVIVTLGERNVMFNTNYLTTTILGCTACGPVDSPLFR